MEKPRYVVERRTAGGQIRYRARIKIDGRCVFPGTFDTPEEAEEAALRARRDALASVLTLAEACSVVTMRTRARRSEATVHWYADRFRVLKAWFTPDRALSTIEAEDVESFIEGRRKDVGDTTIAHELCALSRVFRVAIADGNRLTDPTMQATRVRPSSGPADYFERVELAAILAKLRAANLTDSADIIELVGLTGLRRSECLRLHRGDVSVAGATLFVRGKRRDESVPLTERAVEILERLMATADGPHPMDERRFRRAWRAARREIPDKRLHPHALRHSYATVLARSGVPLHQLQRLMRVTSPAMVQRYYHHGKELRAALRQAFGQPPARPEGEQVDGRAG